MKKTLLGLLVVTLAMIGIAYFSGGIELFTAGLGGAALTASQAVPLILAAFLVIGQLQMLLTPEVIKTLLEKYSGNRGIAFSALAGGLMPGGPYILYPFLVGFRGKGIPFYLLYSFVIGKHGYDFTRLPLEISLISPGLALLRNLITLPVPFLMGLLSRRFFPDGPAGVNWEREAGQ